MWFVGATVFEEPPSPQRAFTLSNSTLSGGGSANASYDIGILETQDFYLGLLKPVDLATVNFFIRQGYSRELLFWLFADAVRETIMGQAYEFVNDPNPDLACQMVQGSQRCFGDMVDVAIASGLTIEIKIEEKSSWPSVSLPSTGVRSRRWRPSCSSVASSTPNRSRISSQRLCLVPQHAAAAHGSAR